MRVSEIRVNQIRVNQGLGVVAKILKVHIFAVDFVKVLIICNPQVLKSPHFCC